LNPSIIYTETPMSTPFIHLRLHTEYSIEDSILKIDNLAQTAKDLQLPALAITDQMNLFAAIKFYRAMRSVGIKPILGADAWLANERTPAQPFQLTLLCQNEQGYHNLMQLVSRAYQTRIPHHRPVLRLDWVKEKATGLIMLSGGIQGEIGQALLEGRKEEAISALGAWQSLFPGRFYMELQRMGQPGEASYIAAACRLAQHYQIPVVATQDMRFLKKQDFEAHEARVCIQQGYTLNNPRRPKQYTAEQYLKSTEIMQELFMDIPSALANSVEIAKRCNVTLELDKIHLPHFLVPSEVDDKRYLVQEAEKGLQARLSTRSQATEQKIITPRSHDSLNLYQKRLQEELKVINDMGFASYFLIVADFIHWAKQEKIPVGPGRGSGAGSLVAYALQITDVDPLHYGLLFERFLNAERVSLPDFDIDFCMEHRDRVIDYVINRYGREAVSQIITFGTMAARAVIRDVGRVLGYPYGMVDSIAKLVPFEVGMTLAKALQQDESASYSLKGRYEREEEVRSLIDLAQQLEGLVRNVGTHAGGVVIAPTQLTNFSSLYYESGSAHAITQFDKDDLEKIGLVKFDFLGLRTLTIIDWAVASINKKRTAQNKPLLDITSLSLDDSLTFLLLQSGKVTAVFQLESQGMRTLLKRLAPDHFEDIVALIALFRPGPLQSGMVDDFIERKHDPSQIRYLHPLLEPILRPTYGVILYQEQVMQIAQILAGYSLGAADLLRRAMGKKKPAEMAKQRAVFMQGSEKKGIDKVLASTIFDLIEKFAGYGFNKSHSVAYALIAYQTAWLKAHYPTEFMAAVLSSEMEHTEKLAQLLYECRSLGLAINSPNIRTSQYAFSVNEAGQIEYGLGGIKGLGRAAINHLLTLQAHDGSFQDLFELCRRIDSDKVNRRALEAFIYSGSLDHFGQSRSSLSAQLAPAIQAAAHHITTLLTKQADLFGDTTINNPVNQQSITETLWTSREQADKEKSVLGLYWSKHPLTHYIDELSHLHLVPLEEIEKKVTQSCVLCAAWLVTFRIKLTARGYRFAILLLENEKSRIELKLSHEQYQAFRASLVKNCLLVLELDIYTDNVRQIGQVRVKQLWDIVGIREKWGRCLRLRIMEQIGPQQDALLSRLQQHLKLAQGDKCTVVIEYHRTDAIVPLALGKAWKVKPKDELLENLRVELGPTNVWIEYSTTCEKA
jgi:DNA polymerase III subunit alpha